MIKEKSYICIRSKNKAYMKRINLTTGILLIYLAVMSFMGWPGHRPDPSYTGYFATIAATLAIIFLLRYLQIKRWKMRQQRQQEQNDKRKSN